MLQQYSNEFYQPLSVQITKWYEEFRKKPLIVAINGPQGCGKTTLCEALVAIFKKNNLQALAISIDDFYLTHFEQKALSAKYPSEPLLAQRGYPGTHDIDLGLKTLSALKNIPPEGVLCPGYDKSAHRGAGDRLPESQWKTIYRPLDILLLEGWMLGFSPLKDPPPQLKVVNQMLKDYHVWNEFFDTFIHLEAEKIDFISHWRIEAEEKRKVAGVGGMSTQEITDYIAKFIPAYHWYVPQLRANPPGVLYYAHIPIAQNRFPARSLKPVAGTSRKG